MSVRSPVRQPDGERRAHGEVCEDRRVRLVQTRDPELWDALVAAATGGTLFHRWGWLDLQARIQGAPIDRLLVWEGDAPIGVFPVPRRRGPAIDTLPAPFPYLGPLVPVDRLAGTIAAFRRWQLLHGVLLGRFEFAPDAPPATARMLAASGCVVREDATVVVDLRHGSLDAMQAAYSSIRRRDIRRAIRDGVSVRPARAGEAARLLPEVLGEAFEAHGRPSPYPADFGARIETWAAGRPDVGMFTALVGDEPAGIQVVIGGGPTAMAWVGASLRRFRAANPNVLLYQALLQWALERGCEEVDLCGVVDDGVRRYKLAFGGVERSYLRVESFFGPKRLRARGSSTVQPSGT